MQPKFDHKVMRPFAWVPAAFTDVSKTIERERDRIEKEKQLQAQGETPGERNQPQTQWHGQGDDGGAQTA